MADALNRRLHGETIAAKPDRDRGARASHRRRGDLIISRRNDPTVTIFEATGPVPASLAISFL
jgi:hypothetical protein